jgi:hypothetical protein
MDLGDPKWLRLLKLEAQEKNQTMKDVLVTALDAYFMHRLETKALWRAAESAFAEWDNPLDADYDKL